MNKVVVLLLGLFLSGCNFAAQANPTPYPTTSPTRSTPGHLGVWLIGENAYFRIVRAGESHSLEFVISDDGKLEVKWDTITICVAGGNKESRELEYWLQETVDRPGCRISDIGRLEVGPFGLGDHIFSEKIEGVPPQIQPTPEFEPPPNFIPCLDCPQA